MVDSKGKTGRVYNMILYCNTIYFAITNNLISCIAYLPIFHTDISIKSLSFWELPMHKKISWARKPDIIWVKFPKINFAQINYINTFFSVNQKSNQLNRSWFSQKGHSLIMEHQFDPIFGLLFGISL